MFVILDIATDRGLKELLVSMATLDKKENLVPTANLRVVSLYLGQKVNKVSQVLQEKMECLDCREIKDIRVYRDFLVCQATLVKMACQERRAKR